jgi:MFS family permease
LLFADRGWSQGWLAYAVFAAVFILARLAFGHLPDRIGGAKVAWVCALIEAAGQALIWLAPWSALALLGAALTGLGYSLVYPGSGVEAVHRVPPESRGLAMGAYTACLDLALGAGGPALGLIAGGAGLGAVFLASALIALCSVPIALKLGASPCPFSRAAKRTRGGADVRRAVATAGWTPASESASPARAGPHARETSRSSVLPR